MSNSFINGLILVLPILLVRFLLLSILNKDSVRRAAFFPPTMGIEKYAYLVNVVTTILLLVIPFFLTIKLHGLVGYLGLGLTFSGLVLYAVSIIQFAKPDPTGIAKTGLYNFSRNPMYVAFFMYFLGCCLLTRSWLLLGVLVIFQFSVHYLIISEERWCREKFARDYTTYSEKVNRYI